MDNDNDDDTSIERSLADLEILTAAYPDEVSTNSSDQTKRTFPLHFTLSFSVQDYIVFEINQGYPIESGLTISSYRSKPNEKSRMEATIAAVRKVANECLEDGLEGGMTCCSVALETWQQDESIESNDNDANDNDIQEKGSSKIDNQQSLSNFPERIYEWISGEPFVDRKSTFQAHLCKVTTEKEVKAAIYQLINGSSKLQRATHNMVAWRLTETLPDGTKILKHDNDDDGEHAAGSKLAFLLEMRKDDGVVVVVSRWFGGIHLGPVRFAHINNVARDLLVSEFQQQGGQQSK